MVERAKSNIGEFGRIALRVRDLGPTDYRTVFDAMRAFTDTRDANSTDEIWLTEHEAIFTQGQAGRPEHVLSPADIPVVATDRGGQVTYHGPGQVVAYTMFDIGRMGIGVRALVGGIESAMIAALGNWNIEAEARDDARGVYVGGRKIGALGLRIRHGRAYHGLALNVAMDLTPFSRIDPCGLVGMDVTQVSDLGGPADLDVARAALVRKLALGFGFDPSEADPDRWIRGVPPTLRPPTLSGTD
ncbi:MAG: lipoyl(octanoyl) transferase LipB [Gammaproteobacteria bacterium]|nr:lipoyl(octanoyl) transferase LipB [Gammaproteobacteria bacterium]MDE0226269.1 lipoyl(octanoyl) transferase LipB [Gammaproteobacteria bacterium]